MAGDMKKGVVAYIVVLHCLLVVVLVKTDFVVRVGRMIGVCSPAYVYKGPRILADKMQSFYERVDKNVPKGSVIVIGDSLVQGLCVGSVCLGDAKRIAVGFGIGGDTLEGITTRLKRLSATLSASIIVVEGGINDLFTGASDDEFKARYLNLLDAIPQGIPFVSVLMFPVMDGRWSVGNDRIEQLNRWISDKVSEKGGRVCDIGRVLLDNGELSSRYHIGDGLHLNREGNAVFMERLQEIIMHEMKNRESK